MQAKPVQIAVIVIGLLVGVVGIVLAVSRGDRPQLADQMILVDVSSGDTFSVSINNRSIVLPMKHPDTQERTLLPIELKEDDSWQISSRYMSAMKNIDNVSSVVNTENGVVSIPEDVKHTKISD